MAEAENIVVWALPRTGSTYLQQMLVGGLWQVHGRQTRNLHESSGIGGFILDWMTKPRIDFGWALGDTPYSIAEQEYLHWKINPRGLLVRKKVFGDPITEVKHRAALIKEGAWNNNVVFKSIRWGDAFAEKKQLDDLYDDAILNSKKKIHNVIVWRRNAADALHSWMVMKSIKNTHGHYNWFGAPIDFPGKPEAFHRAYMNTHKDFIDAVNKLDHLNTVMVEISAIDKLERIEWDDGSFIPVKNPKISGKFSKAVDYINEYTDVRNMQQVRPVDMLSEHSKKIAANIIDDIQAQYDWKNLDRWVGMKCYE